MTPKNREALRLRVVHAAEAALQAHGYASAVDVLIGMAGLDAERTESWRRRRVDSLERLVHANLSRISEAMKLFRAWGMAKNLRPSETVYLSWTRPKMPLRFSRSGDPGIERWYRTHWLAPQPARCEPEQPPVETPQPG